MTESPGEVIRAYVGTFVAALAAAGVRDVCLCPGSRSTPLAVMVRENPGLKTWIHLDERSCAYFALGMAKLSRRPVALVCTSGTAALNFAPAVAEAFYAHVPLVVLTADRPAELRGIAANQTIDQVRLYGGHVKWAEEMLLPEHSPAALRYAATMAARAVASAWSPAPGPVHLNLPFREPLMPSAASGAQPATVDIPAVMPGRAALDQPAVQEIAAALAGASRGLIVCGPQEDPDFPAAVASLADALGFPIVADPLSQVRGGPHSSETVVANYDNFLRAADVAAQLAPDCVLRFGAPPVSKALGQFLERARPAAHYLVCEADTWPDPERTATALVFADPTSLCLQLTEEVQSLGREDAESDWLPAWRWLAVATEKVLATHSGESLSEVQVFRSLANCLEPGDVLYAGNSMPVRDLDSFFPARSCAQTFLANRGTSGIDGVVSSALGAAAAAGRRVVLVIGDLSLYHDLNGLLALRRFGLKATVVLINNDGGGIFSFLPQAGEAEDFEDLFGTPHGLDFRPAAALHGLTYVQPSSTAGFEAAVRKSQKSDDSYLIEVRTDRTENVAVHNRIWSDVAAAAREALKA